jgi:ComF family protein
MDMLKSAWKAILDFIFPRDITCISCNRDIMPERSIYSLCHRCMDGLRLNMGNRCSQCGRPIAGEDGHICAFCALDGNYGILTAGISPFHYEATSRRLITKFKYDDMRFIGGYMADMIIDYDRDALSMLQRVDIFLPVPDHPSRRRVRGFNQCEEISRELARRLGKECASSIVVRRKRTKRLKELTREERETELEGAFAIGNLGGFDKAAAICIVDDILTTGSTSRAIGRLLRNAGFRNIYLVTVASKAN